MSCLACRGCGVTDSNRESANVHELVQVLWNSWGKPLLLVVAVAVGCSGFGVGEGVSILLVILAMSIGIYFCREVRHAENNYFLYPRAVRAGSRRTGQGRAAIP